MGSTRDALARIAGGLYELYGNRDAARVARAVARALSVGLDCELALHVGIAPDRRSGRLACWPEDALPGTLTADLIARHEREHPLVARMAADRAIRAWRLVDVDDQGRFEGTALYRDLFAGLPARRQMAMRLASPDGSLHAVAVARSGAEFSDEERRSLELLWPHLVRALRAARAARRVAWAGQAVEGRIREARGVVLLRADLRVELCTEQARLWLAEYFPDAHSRYRIALPRPVQEWASARVGGERVGRFNPVNMRDPLIVWRGDRYLAADLVVDHGKGEHLMTLAEEELAAPAESLRDLGLTLREAQVLSWVAQGKTNREVGLILGASGRTVQKHLEHVFQKLGVESRAAATIRAWQAGRYGALGRG